MKKKYLLLITIMLSVMLIDQLTKWVVLKHFNLNETLVIIKNYFSLTYVRNPGAAFSLFNTSSPSFRIPFLIGTPIVALAAIFFTFRRIDDDDFFLATALSLVVGGAAGNLIDRISYNYVIDFLFFYWHEGGPGFPVFNIADMAISFGVGLLILDIFRKERVRA